MHRFAVSTVLARRGFAPTRCLHCTTAVPSCRRRGSFHRGMTDQPWRAANRGERKDADAGVVRAFGMVPVLLTATTRSVRGSARGGRSGAVVSDFLYSANKFERSLRSESNWWFVEQRQGPSYDPSLDGASIAPRRPIFEQGAGLEDNLAEAPVLRKSVRTEPVGKPRLTCSAAQRDPWRSGLEGGGTSSSRARRGASTVCSAAASGAAWGGRPWSRARPGVRRTRWPETGGTARQAICGAAKNGARMRADAPRSRCSSWSASGTIRVAAACSVSTRVTTW